MSLYIHNTTYRAVPHIHTQRAPVLPPQSIITTHTPIHHSLYTHYTHHGIHLSPCTTPIHDVHLITSPITSRITSLPPPHLTPTATTQAKKLLKASILKVEQRDVDLDDLMPVPEHRYVCVCGGGALALAH